MTIDDLLEIRRIEQLKYRYMRAVDTQDWALMERCFAPDATAAYNSGLYTANGRGEIVGFLQGVLNSSFNSSHIALHPEITLDGPDRASGIWRMQDIVHFSAANPNAREATFLGGEEMVGAGYYYDDYVRLDGEWLISHISYVRLFEKVSPPDTRPGAHLAIDPKRGVR